MICGQGQIKGHLLNFLEQIFTPVHYSHYAGIMLLRSWLGSNGEIWSWLTQLRCVSDFKAKFNNAPYFQGGNRRNRGRGTRHMKTQASFKLEWWSKWKAFLSPTIWMLCLGWISKEYFLVWTFLHFRVDATMAVIVKDADMPQSAPTSLLLDQHAGFIAK